MNYKIYQQYRIMAAQSRKQIMEFKDKISGENVYIVGTGPSIEKTDLKKLNNKHVIFLNNAINLHGLFRPKSSFVVISDHLRAIELRRIIANKKIPCFVTTDKIFNPSIDPKIFSTPYLFMMPKVADKPDGGMQISSAFGFSDDLNGGVYLGKSVAFPAIQFGYHLGAKVISLVGIDMTIGKNVSYYDAAIKSNWSEFNYRKDGRPHFEVVRDCLLSRNIVLENLTVGGNLDVLPHRPFALSLEGEGCST